MKVRVSGTKTSVARRTATLLHPIAFALSIAILTPAPTLAQEVSVEELEEQLEKQKMALEEVIANRESTAEKAKEVREALAEAEKRKSSVEEELKALCDEQEELVEGSFDDCMASSEG